MSRHPASVSLSASDGFAVKLAMLGAPAPRRSARRLDIFLDGVARTMDLDAVYTHEALQKTLRRSYRGAWEDWENVGRDLRLAMNEAAKDAAGLAR